MKKIFILILIFIPVIVLAENTPPSKPSESGNLGSSSVRYNGASSITSDTSIETKTYTSTNGGQNALLVSGGTSTIKNITLNKTGDESSENSDFYGTNAGILVYNNASLNILGGNITTNGSHANAVFAYSNGIINISDVTINTTGNNSGGIMVTGGGIINASNLTVSTSGNSSASIRSDRGGGTLTVTGGNFTTTGVGSPAIYSTANIIVNDAALTSTSSEGVVVEGANSISLNNVVLIDTNTTLNGNSETYKNIFLYQSMSGDASVGNATFTAKDSTITTNKGDTIFVTNTTATVNLENNTIVNTDGYLLRIQAGKWGTSGSNGGSVTLNMSNQKVSGNIAVDSISTLSMELTNNSNITGTINANNTAQNITLSLSSNSSITLTGNCYINSLINEDNTNSNINLDNYKLYVNGEEIKANNDVVTIKDEVTNIGSSKTSFNNQIIIYTAQGMGIIIVGLTIYIVIKRKKK